LRAAVLITAGKLPDERAATLARARAGWNARGAPFVAMRPREEPASNVLFTT
jgi:hypothetical protein